MAFTRKPAARVYRTRAHRDARAQMVAAHTPGDPCCICGHPMWGDVSELHADHVPGTTDQYRGLAHGTVACQDCGVKCNVVDGARRGRAQQDVTDLVW